MHVRILCLALLLVGLAAAVQAEEWTKTYPVSGKPEVHVDIDDGPIRVSTSNEGGVRASVSTCGWKISSDGVRVEEHQSGNRIEIAVKVPRGPHFVIGCKTVSLELAVPNAADLDLHSGDGSISVDGVKGTAQLSTGDGRIEASKLDGNLKAHTGDGNIDVDGRFDSLTLHASDGRIEAAARPGSRLVSAWSLETSDGNVKLRLPRDIAADIDAHTADGRIDSDFEGLTQSGTEDAHSLRGKLNGGGAYLQIRTADGGIGLLRY